MRQDRFRVAGRIVEIQRAVGAANATPLPAARPGVPGLAAARGKRELTWHILVGRQRIGVVHRRPNGLYVCGRYAEHDLRRLACRVMGVADEAAEELSVP